MLQNSYKQKLRANADCKQLDETTEHIMAACLIVAKDQYMERYVRL
jgi:hypothetical protein